LICSPSNTPIYGRALPLVKRRAAAGIEAACPQGQQGWGPRGAEATLGAPANPLAPALLPAD